MQQELQQEMQQEMQREQIPRVIKVNSVSLLLMKLYLFLC